MVAQSDSPGESSLRIVDIKTSTVAVPLKPSETRSWFREGPEVIDSVIVQVETEEGFVGLGEAPPVLGADMTKALLDTATSEFLGHTPFELNRLIRTIYARHNLAHLHPHAASWAINGVEMALWDLLGKVCGQPLYKIWGGAYRLDIPFYAHIERRAPEAMRDEAARAVESGFDTLYTKVGFDLDSDLAAVAAMREAAPSPKVRIRVDANQGWSPGEAIRAIRALEPYGLEFVEQPVLMYNLESLAHVRNAVTVPIAAHESGWTMYEVLNVVKRQAADIIHVDPRFDLGLTGARNSAAIAEAAGLPVVAHSFGELGVAFAATLQLIAATPNFTLANQVEGYSRLEDDVVRGGPLQFDGNRVRVPDAPGLGVMLDLDKVKAYEEVYDDEVRQSGYSRRLRNPYYAAMHFRSHLRSSESS